jgi:hypothetical protein
VHADRLPEAQAAKARRVCRQQSRKKGHQPTPQSLLLAGWVLVVTSLPPTLLPGSTALALYRVRWQIEIAIKRWKSVLDVDLLRARYESPLADVWLHGKLLYVLLLDRRLRRTLGEQWTWFDRERTATWWRPWKLLRAEVAPRITGRLSCAHPRWPSALPVLAERPRRRQLQRLPQAVIYIFALSAPPRQPAPPHGVAASPGAYGHRGTVGLIPHKMPHAHLDLRQLDHLVGLVRTGVQTRDLPTGAGRGLDRDDLGGANSAC